MSATRSRRWRRRLVFSLVPLVISIVAIEGFCRSFPLASSVRRLGYIEPDPELIWRLKPLAAGPQATNELGLRDTTYRADADVKVLLLGDSISYGDGERDLLKGFPYLLEEALSARDPIRTYEVINSGVVGYSTFQEVRYLELRGLALRPHVVILQFCLNDVTERYRSVARYGGSSSFFGVDTRSSLRGVHGWLVRHSKAYARAAAWGQDAAKREETYEVARLFEEPLTPELESAWAETEADLERLRALCKSSGLPLLLVVTPYRFQLEDPARRGPLARLEAWSAARGVPFVDLLPAFVRAQRGGQGDLFFDANHLAPAGNRLVAAGLEGPVADVIARQGLPPGR